MNLFASSVWLSVSLFLIGFVRLGSWSSFMCLLLTIEFLVDCSFLSHHVRCSCAAFARSPLWHSFGHAAEAFNGSLLWKQGSFHLTVYTPF